jgi:hypothetical protein
MLFDPELFRAPPVFLPERSMRPKGKGESE